MESSPPKRKKCQYVFSWSSTQFSCASSNGIRWSQSVVHGMVRTIIVFWQSQIVGRSSRSCQQPPHQRISLRQMSFSLGFCQTSWKTSKGKPMIRSKICPWSDRSHLKQTVCCKRRRSKPEGGTGTSLPKCISDSKSSLQKRSSSPKKTPAVGESTAQINLLLLVSRRDTARVSWKYCSDCPDCSDCPVSRKYSSDCKIARECKLLQLLPSRLPTGVSTKKIEK